MFVCQELESESVIIDHAIVVPTTSALHNVCNKEYYNVEGLGQRKRLSSVSFLKEHNAVDFFVRGFALAQLS